MDVKEADYITHDVTFASGQGLATVKIHYRTLGNPQKGADGEIANAVLMLHGTTSSGAQFLAPETAGFLFGKGQPLDTEKYFIILPDSIGHGGSSRPSDGLKARFPNYTYTNMIEAQHSLITEGLSIKKLRLITGTSMGGMHTWMWGERHPDAMKALAPIACVPEPVKGRNLLWRRILVDSIVNDPGYQGGDYEQQPHSLGVVWQLFRLMEDSAAHLEKEINGIAKADANVHQLYGTAIAKEDANNVAYAFNSSRDYNPSEELGSLIAPLLAINFEDDQLNPVELGVLDSAIKKVRHGRAVTIPAGPKTKGHSTLHVAELWAPYIQTILDETAEARE